MLEFTEILPDTVHCWIGDSEAALVDVRKADELAQARLKKALRVSMSAFEPELLPVDTGRKVVFICAGIPKPPSEPPPEPIPGVPPIPLPDIPPPPPPSEPPPPGHAPPSDNL